jgi:O-antigen/teichoic acid export membrane protein
LRNVAAAGRPGSAGPAEATPISDSTRRYGRGARALSAGIATTGLVTFAFFALASHALPEVDYKGITLLWSVMFLIISIIYRPVELLLSRTIAVRRAQGLRSGHPLRIAVAIQLGFAVAFLAVALALRERIEREVFDGSATLYWVLLVGVSAYAASYFARGWLAGHQRFGLYGGLVLMEALSRCLFALAAAVGIATGQGVVALGIAAAPLVSLVVVPIALRRREDPAPAGAGAGDVDQGGLSLSAGAGFAGAVLVTMAAEQALLNGPILIVDATSTDATLAGFAFNVLLITRAPLQLFQAIQTTLLPHLSSLQTTDSDAEFRHALRVILGAIAGFAALVVLGLALIGPWAMGLLFGGDFDYGRLGLVLVGLGMGCHLAAGTLNQAALARGRAAWAAVAWLVAAALFLGWLALSPLDDALLAVEVGYAGSVAALAVALWAIERTGGRPRGPATSSASSAPA